MPKLIPPPGSRFDRLTVERVERDERSRVWCVCRCDCGGSKVTRLTSLRSGDVRSCGCWRRERAGLLSLSHGDAAGEKPTVEWTCWHMMKQRCENPRHKSFKDYGGRGIRVCERWRESFANFLADMGRRPSARHQIDRINNDGNYGPGNVRWATVKQNSRNRRNAIFVEFQGERVLLIELCERRGLSYTTIAARLRAGWPTTRALTKPVRGAA